MPHARLPQPHHRPRPRRPLPPRPNNASESRATLSQTPPDEDPLPMATTRRHQRQRPVRPDEIELDVDHSRRHHTHRPPRPALVLRTPSGPTRPRPTVGTEWGHPPRTPTGHLRQDKVGASPAGGLPVCGLSVQVWLAWIGASRRRIAACAHVVRTSPTTYRPGAALARLIRAREPECRIPPPLGSASSERYPQAVAARSPTSTTSPLPRCPDHTNEAGSGGGSRERDRWRPKLDLDHPRRHHPHRPS